MPDLQINRAGTDQLRVVRDIAEKTWPQAYGAILSEEQIAYMLDRFYSDQALRKQLSEGHLFLTAVSAGMSIGFAAFEPHYQPGVTKLQKLYVLPEAQGTGAGKALLVAVIDLAKALGQENLVLNVNRFNTALRFYQKNGFQILREEDIDIGQGYFMNDYVMIRSLG